jgi:hypothetical protein
MDRLLNEEEKETALLGIPACGDNPKRNLLQHKHAADRISEAQRDLTRKETLKEVGEWMRKKQPRSFALHRSPNYTYISMLPEDIESLLRGEMPK